jgi:thiol-disulfide isomerase/thioredoxin
MKKIILLLSVYSSCLFSQIGFEKLKWDELKLKAQKENKLIFVDAYTTWCGPCKWMEKNVFSDRKVGEEYNGKFINAKFDMESGEGPMLGKQYEIGCYPTYLFIDRNGKVIHRVTGQMAADEFINQASVASNPSLNFSGIQQRYEAGEREPAFVLEYIHQVTYNCMNAEKVASSYLSELKKEDLLTQNSWNIFVESIQDPHDAPFVYFISHRSDYAKVFGENAVNQKIFDVYANIARALIYRSEGPDEAGLGELNRELSAIDFARKDELYLMIANHKAEANRNWVGYYESGKLLVDKYKGSDSDFLNTISYTLFKHSKDKSHLEVAETWAKRSVELDEGFANLDTYACLLNRNGKKDQAIATQKKAIAKAKDRGVDSKDLEKTLKEIQSGKG